MKGLFFFKEGGGAAAPQRPPFLYPGKAAVISNEVRNPFMISRVGMGSEARDPFKGAIPQAATAKPNPVRD